jgi:hypothetical protein
VLRLDVREHGLGRDLLLEREIVAELPEGREPVPVIDDDVVSRLRPASAYDVAPANREAGWNYVPKNLADGDLELRPVLEL